jgi:hypothetical protein
VGPRSPAGVLEAGPTTVVIGRPHRIAQPSGAYVVDGAKPLVRPLTVAVVEDCVRWKRELHGNHALNAGMAGTRVGWRFSRIALKYNRPARK